MKRIIFLLLFYHYFSSYQIAKGENTLILEHTFPGYYYPHNFPIYSVDDEEKYFYPFFAPIDNRHIIATTYNEDYSVKDEIDVTLQVPEGTGSTYSIFYNPSLRFPDGRPFLIATFQGWRTMAFDAISGELVLDLGDSFSTTQIQPYIYLINGKPSLILVFIMGVTSGIINYETRIYSFSEEINQSDIQSNNITPRRIYCVDVNGRIINEPIANEFIIQVFNDGSTQKIINR